MSPAIFEWEGVEYEHNPKSADWYWAIGIVATALTVACIIFGSYLLAVLIIVAGSTLALHAAKAPPVHQFQITDEGLVIGHQLYPFHNMRSFSMFEFIESKGSPVLSVKTESWLSPHLLIPLNAADADHVYEYFLARVKESEHKDTLADLVAGWLGF